MISQTAEYALRAAAWLGEHPGNSCTVQDVAAATATPPEYLSKVLQEMARAGLVSAQRGPSGGYRLSRSSSDISVLEVVEAVSPLSRVRECPLGRPDHRHQLCPLHQLLDDAVASVECAFRRVTIADLIAKEGAPSVLRKILANGTCRARPVNPRPPKTITPA